MSRHWLSRISRIVARVLSWLMRVFSRRRMLQQPSTQDVVEDHNTTGKSSSQATVEPSDYRRSVEVGGSVENSTIAIGDHATVIRYNNYTKSAVPGESNRFGVPYPYNPYFSGREETLSQLHEQLSQKSAIAMTQVQAVSGLGGIGKTQTAVEYAYRYYKEVYSTVLWVSADTKATLETDYAAIAEQLALPNVHQLKPSEKIVAVRAWLNTNDGWLLVFDNADEPDLLLDWMPGASRGKVLITSRASTLDQLGIDSPIVLDVLTPTETVELLFKRTGVEKTTEAIDDAIALNTELDGLPLALEQASAYIRNQRITIGLYLSAYRKRGLTQLEKAKARTGRYPSSVLKTWQLNMESVTAEEPAAAVLLQFSAQLSPEQIPTFIFMGDVSNLCEPLKQYVGSASRFEEQLLAANELLALLNRYSLVKWDVTGKSYSVHRLVQAVVRSQTEESKITELLEQVIDAVTYHYSGDDYKQWPLCTQLLPHWLHLAQLGRERDITTQKLGQLCHFAGRFLFEQARYQESEVLLKQCLQIEKKCLGVEHLDIATSLRRLADLYKGQSRLGEAEPLYRESLRIYRKHLHSGHPDIANSLNNLASLCKHQSRYEEAESLYKEALHIRRKQLGTTRPDVASSLTNLASLYRCQERYEEAEALLNQALPMFKSQLGDSHPYVAIALLNLADIHREQGYYEEAEPLYEEVLRIRRKQFGDNHPVVRSTLIGLRELYESQVDVALSLNSLAGLAGSRGKHDEAESLYEQALYILIKRLGEEHTTTQSVRNNLAD